MAIEDFEIIVVDNGSTDATERVVCELSTIVPNLRYVRCPEAGLSSARNCGLKQAAAPVVAFLDDDAIADAGWLTAIVDGFGIEPRPVAVGGPVAPWWEVPKPGWFPDSLIGCHNRNYGPVPRWYRYPAEAPIGCNMALQKHLALEAGGFNSQFHNYNDETELISRLVQGGGRLFYQPRATVRHFFAKERLNLLWQIRRHYEEGKSIAGMAALSRHASRFRRLGLVGHNFLSIARRSARVFVSRGPVRDRVERLTDLFALFGQTVYLAKSLAKK
jgi:glycosyltransferase involved in cell wall biosynthesis